MKRRVGILISTTVVCLTAAPAAHATFLMDAQIDFTSDPIAVGSSGTGTLSFTNDSTVNEDADSVDRVVLEPSCRNPGQQPPCTDREPGIFSIGTGTGVTGTACAGTTFNVTTSNAAPFQGSLDFTPSVAIPDMLVNATCAITFTYTALAVPTIDTQGEDGTQTDQIAIVRAEHNGGGPTIFCCGTGDTTVNPAPATTQQPPPAATPTPAPVPKKKCKKAKKHKRSAVAAKKCKKKR